jgi:hypothetical protein
MDKLLTEIQVSDSLQVSLACLRRWRLRVAYPIFCTSWIVSVAQLLMYLDGCRMGREELGSA